ncbi:hypothetical protein [Gilvimarinus algae]|uniref:Uncharacterized protein n=1 Tax=Gilvimarinus algae TaxID=3058037 RepID=A0ABT8THP5_9GAMM|nr:hypothetical protein [Gilvimarinus sp. SDUM040014]MDO3383436.1 hypothetical protein [Gilvimarinus sp. SDUM040014]
MNRTVKKEKSKDYDMHRHAMQAPVAPEGHLFTVHWHPGSYRLKERRSPRLNRRSHAHRLLKLLQKKYGENMAIIWVH